MNYKKPVTLAFLISTLSACHVGPNYQKPTMTLPSHYKEAKNTAWRIAKPNDLENRGDWWTIFHDPQLNALEKELNKNDQNIIIAKAQYLQAVALVDQARAAYFPTLSATAALISQGNNNGKITSSSASNHTRNLGLNATWESDIWGVNRRNVESTGASAESSRAQLAAVQLSEQANLAQYYVELRGADSDQQLLNKIVVSNQKIVLATQNKMKEGVYSLANVIQARSALDTAKQLAENNKINRALYEHAIAVLLGKTPADFSLSFNPYYGKPPIIAAQLPSQLLERRPDIAAAERNVASANAKIGAAKGAYFPSLTFSSTATFSAATLSEWSSWPLFAWSVGPALAETIFDGGLRGANLNFARENYNATVAQYRETVLTAFQNVEDSLAQLRFLQLQSISAEHAKNDANTGLALSKSQFESGTLALPDVNNAEITALNARKNAVDVTTLRMTYTVALIKAMGGGYIRPLA